MAKTANTSYHGQDGVCHTCCLDALATSVVANILMLYNEDGVGVVRAESCMMLLGPACVLLTFGCLTGALSTIQ